MVSGFLDCGEPQCNRNGTYCARLDDFDWVIPTGWLWPGLALAVDKGMESLDDDGLDVIIFG